MKKIISLIKASMTSDMNIFKINTKKKNKKTVILPLVIALYLMFMIWGYANTLFEKFEPFHIQYLVLSLLTLITAIMTIIEGIYKTGSLIFNCKDDQLLLSLPIKRSTVLFIRIFKFYVFELLFNSIFMFPVMLAYIRWGSIDWTYYLTSIIMLLILPIIPIVISCIIGAITSSLTGRFKYKNAAQIIISMVIIIGILLLSYTFDNILDYLMKNAKNINDMITKLYYPAGIYTKLVTDFNAKDLIIFIIVNIGIFAILIHVLSKFYFNINSRLKKVTSSKNTEINKLKIKQRTKTISLIKKEISTFFNTPVFIINAGFALVLYIIGSIYIALKYDSFLPMITNIQLLNLNEEIIASNSSILILLLISAAAFMTSITNSVISLEGKNINILKSLPIKTKTILMSKIYFALSITTPAILIGNIVLFIKLKTGIIESLLLIILSILIPLVSHFIGLIINLKYPKLDAENSTEVVKQSMSSFISVMIGMLLLIIYTTIISNLIGTVSAKIILFLSTIFYTIVNIILYIYLIKKSTKEFDILSI